MFGFVERTAIFIDGSNLWATAQALGFRIDFRKFMDKLSKRCYLAAINYYTAVQEDANGHQNIRGFIDILSHQGYRVIEKKAKTYHSETLGPITKGNMDVDMACDMLDIGPYVDRVVMVTGDCDFLPVVERLHRIGRRITVISTIKTRPAMCSEELLKAVDDFVDLADMIPAIMRQST